MIGHLARMRWLRGIVQAVPRGERLAPEKIELHLRAVPISKTHAA